MDEAPKPIRLAVAQLAGIPGVVLESILEFVPSETSWAFRVRLTSLQSSDFVPRETLWVVLVDDVYPDGHIRLFPARDEGLTATFPHQDRNVVWEANPMVCRTGKPCLDSPLFRLGRIAGGPEPRGDSEQRLRWYIERCLVWLELAASDQLMLANEPFELPQCPAELFDQQISVIHDEGGDTWPFWSGRLRTYGEVRWKALPGLDKAIVAEEFYDAHGSLIRCCRRRAPQGHEPWIGYWWLWPAPIVIPPWHAPGTWADMRLLGSKSDVDVDEFLWWIAHRAGGKDAVVLLIGYPIPRLWHGAPEEIHWQAFHAPYLPSPIKPLKGFRANAIGEADRLRRDIFQGSKPLHYLKTANWHPDRLQARGRFSVQARACSVALIGGGALGSAVAELLARGGVTTLLIIDYDVLEAGNLVRHTLTCANLGCNKASALATRLQQAAPMSRITSFAGCLPHGQELLTLLEPFDVVLDCTGNDEVLRSLGETWWPIPRSFVSASMGFAANHVFLFSSHSCTFPVEDFQVALQPWLDLERVQWTVSGETLEGAGCWSPLFPARCDDVWLAAVAVVRQLERLLEGMEVDGLLVLGQAPDKTIPGLHPVTLSPSADAERPTESRLM